MEKYYTPDIEDIRVGYECEFKNHMQSKEWKKEICDTDLVNIAFNDWEHEDEEYKFCDAFRTSYLTKEQIEAERCIKTTDIIFRKDRFIIGYENKNLKISDIATGNTLYYGTCPSINEFRYITKLLKI